MIITLSDLLLTLLGLVLGWVVPIIIYLNRKRLNRKLYSKYIGNYYSYLKDQYSRDIQFTIRLTLKNNVFTIKGNAWHKNKKAEIISGTIEMDKSMHNYGRGYYYHDLGDNPIYKFGFYEIQLNDNSIFVHQIIKGTDNNINGIERSSAYVWEKTSNNF